MESIAERQHERDGATEVMEIDGAAELLMELLDAPPAAEKEAAGRGNRRQLGFPADDVGDDLDTIHPHQEEEAGCEDCGLDGIILSGFYGCGCSPAPYVVDDGGGNPAECWTDQDVEAAAAFGPFTGDCVGEWYMGGMIMEWDDGRSYYSFYPSYGGGGEACSTEELYISPLWE